MPKELDEYERRMHKEGRCICCGQKAHQGKDGLSLECTRCWSGRQPVDFGKYELGNAPFLMSHKYKTLLGYGPSATSAPETPNEKDMD